MLARFSLVRRRQVNCDRLPVDRVRLNLPSPRFLGRDRHVESTLALASDCWVLLNKSRKSQGGMRWIFQVLAERSHRWWVRSRHEARARDGWEGLEDLRAWSNLNLVSCWQTSLRAALSAQRPPARPG